MRRTRWFMILAVMALPWSEFRVLAQAPGANAVASNVPPGLEIPEQKLPADIEAYLQGLEQLQAGNWNPAVQTFTQSIQATANESATYFLARGVALTLAEQRTQAADDLIRAAKLSPGFKEAKVWYATLLGMAGRFQEADGIFPPATNDPYETFLGQLRIDYGQANFLKQQGNVPPEWIAKQQQARQRFRKAGSWFASRMKDSPEMPDALFHRAKVRIGAGEFAAAISDLEFILAKRPNDMAVLYYHAFCALRTGNITTARREQTKVLTEFTAFAPAYIERAKASAELGDGRRTRADLHAAHEIDPDESARDIASVEEKLSAVRADVPKATVAELRKELQSRAESSRPSAELYAAAMMLHKAVLASRLHQDEVYQQQLKALEDSVREDPKNPDRLVKLSEFLTREARRRYDRHTSRGDFRILTKELPNDPEGELKRAESLASKALSIDPRHAAAMVAKARVRFEFHAFAEAEQILEAALALQKDVPDGLELYARVITVGANQSEAAARRLETPDRWVTHETYTTTYWTRYPSEKELQEAERFRQKAQSLLDYAHEILEQAVKLRPADGEGYYQLALWQIQKGDTQAARASLEKALQQADDLVRARQALIKIYHDLGMNDRAFQEESKLWAQTEGSIDDALFRAEELIGSTLR